MVVGGGGKPGQAGMENQTMHAELVADQAPLLSPPFELVEASLSVSAAAARYVPSGLKASDCMYEGPGSDVRGRPSRASQIRVIASPQVVATNDPSGLKAIAVTASLCPLSLSNSCLEARSQIATARSSTPASVAPSGLKASAGNESATQWQRESGALSARSARVRQDHLSSGVRATRPSGLNAKSRRTVPIEAALQGPGGGIVEVDDARRSSPPPASGPGDRSSA